MRVHETMFDDFFARRLPAEGFTLIDTDDEFFGLITDNRPDLHGHVVTMEGDVVVPELLPSSKKPVA